VIEHPHAEPDLFRVPDGGDAPVFAAHALSRAVLNADIAVLGAGRRDALQSKIGEFVPGRSGHE
jgi:hypothetical protein